MHVHAMVVYEMPVVNKSLHEVKCGIEFITLDSQTQFRHPQYGGCQRVNHSAVAHTSKPTGLGSLHVILVYTVVMFMAW